MAVGRRGGTKDHRRKSGLSLVRYRLARSGLRAGNGDAGARRPHDARSAAPDTRIGREPKRWTDQQLDDALLKLRGDLTRSRCGVAKGLRVEPWKLLRERIRRRIG